MTRHLLLPLLLATASAASAQLAPQQPAPLFDHLVEVNAEWRMQDPGLAERSAPVTFSTDAERIAMHLHLVRATLAARNAEGLSATQAAERAGLLAKLDRYADRGLFPQNHVLPYRNPVFIDPVGTACAVGQLMIESGHADLAQRIDREMELYYVHDMHRTDVDAWAVEHGFTEDELAWIQPGYSPSIPWMGLGGGTNGPVTAMKTLPDGHMLVVGNFTMAGTTVANNVAIWNGSTYEALGSGITGTLTCATVYNGTILVGGRFLNGNYDLAAWDGSAWSYTAVFQGKLPSMTALHVHNGTLYAAGQVMGIVGADDVVKRKDATEWTQVGSVFNADVFALGSHEGKLVAGGAFTGLDNATDPLIDHIAVLETNEWLQLGNGLDAPVRALLESNGCLYAGGDAFANVAPTFALARMDSGGSTWQHMLPNHADYMTADMGPSYISCLAARGGSVYFGGNFMMFEGMTMGAHIARLDNAPDAFEIMGNMDAPVNAVVVNGDDLIIGGEFEAMLPHIATVDVSTGILDRTREEARLTLSPNPATELVTVQLPEGFDATAVVRATDAEGRVVEVPVQRTGATLRVETAGLAAGLYTLEAIQDGRSATGRFVKQ